MGYGLEAILDRYREALLEELARLADRLAWGADRVDGPAAGAAMAASLRHLATRIRGPGRRPAAALAALRRLTVVGETAGTLEGGEAILLNRLAFRVGFYQARVTPTLTASQLPARRWSRHGPALERRRREELSKGDDQDDIAAMDQSSDGKPCHDGSERATEGRQVLAPSLVADMDA